MLFRSRLTFAVMPGEPPKPTASAPTSALRAKKMREIAEDPYVKKLVEVLDGEIIRVDPAATSPPPPSAPTATPRPQATA